MRKESVKKIGIWCLAAALFTAHLFFRSVAHADSGPTWQQTFAKTGDCQIAFPAPPQLVQQSLKLSEKGDMLHYDVYLSPLEDKGVFLLLVATYPTALGAGQEVAGLEGLLRGIVGHHQENELVFAEVVQVGGHPAMDFLVQSKNNYFRGRALMVGNKLFLMAMEGQKGTMQEPLFTRFIKSFKLVGLNKN